MQSLFKVFVVVLTTFTLAACGSFDKDRKNTQAERVNPKDIVSNGETKFKVTNTKKRIAKLYAPNRLKQLEIPPNLIASTNDIVLENLQLDGNLQNVLPETLTARVIKDGTSRFLEIDASVESAWEAMLSYWALSGADLVEANPQTGIMETDWIVQARPIAETNNTVKHMVSNIVTSLTNRNATLSKYKVRFERVSPNQSLMFVMIQSIKREGIKHAKKLSEFAWVDNSTENQESVNSFLQNIALIFDHGDVVAVEEEETLIIDQQ